ncbi:MAG TPA: rhodanese-like domain-containing protein [Bryobacteraceae bacterium]|jgi:membrane protein DedA with SNARE-associated domain/rhodanese-related sulfurtransferase|nr:rhodanese-like domain-containing protein [Bryobacteraceae bacterium]
MDSWLSGLSQHGYSILFAAVFLEAVGIPVPAALAMLIAGAAAARGSLHPGRTAATALSAMMAGDTTMFLMGRYTGWWLLSLLCRLSLNPESCILRSADSFYKRGRLLLVVAKFVPGINTMAPPMAGSMNMRLFQFLPLDLAGAALYAGAYLAAGWIFSDALGVVTHGYRMFGRALGWLVIAALAVYLAFVIRAWIKARELRSVPFVSPAEVARVMSSDSAIVYDVRSHGYYDSKATRIKGSKRIEPNALHQFDEQIAAGTQVYLYCTCVREATSARVAQMLQKKGVHTAVIKGGLRAWKKAGLPLETVPPGEIEALPGFDT